MEDYAGNNPPFPAFGTHVLQRQDNMNMWKKPWTLREGFVIGLGLVLVGLMLQWAVGPLYWDIFAWPANIILLALYVLLLAAAYILRGQVYAVRFLMSWRSAVPAIAYAVVLTVVMGVTRQVSDSSEPQESIGISKMLNFWPFILTYVWMSAVVGLVALRQFCHFRPEGLPSLASHLGLFIVLVAGTLGSADMRRMKMYCEVGRPEWRVLDERQNAVELPVAVQLNKFIMEEYPPRLIVIDNRSQQPVMVQGKPLSFTLDSTFRSGQAGNWLITLKNRRGEDIVEVAADWHPQWKARVPRETHVEGLVGCGNYRMPPQMMALGHDRTLAMAEREPKRYASEVEIMTRKGDHFAATIDVNKPVTVDGWKIYQYSYNTQMGKYSNYSVLEFVADPWLPAVYVGIGLLAAGAVGMFFIAGRRKKQPVASQSLV